MVFEYLAGIINKRPDPQNLLNQFNEEEKHVAKVLLDSLILKHTANRLATNPWGQVFDL